LNWPLRAALDLIDLEAAEYAGTDSFSHGESNPYHLFTNTNPLFLPAMLESLVTTVPAAGLVFELNIFCRRFDGTLDAVSDTLAGMLAAELFFNGPLPPRIHPHAKGPAVREIMHRRFGVSSEAAVESSRSRYRFGNISTIGSNRSPLRTVMSALASP